MSEPGPNPSHSEPPPHGKKPFEEEKINNDDLMAILGGVVSPGYAKEPQGEPSAAGVPVPSAETPLAPVPAPVVSAPMTAPIPVVTPPVPTPEVSAPIPQMNRAPKIEIPLPSSTVKAPVPSSEMEDLQDGVSDSEPDMSGFSSQVHPPPSPMEKPVEVAPPPAPAPVSSIPMSAPPATLPPIRPLEPPPPSASKPTVTLPASLMPPGFPQGSPQSGSPAAQADPLHLFDTAPPTAPTAAPSPFPLGMGQKPPMPVKVEPTGAADPLHLFDHPSVAPSPKVEAPVVSPAPMAVPAASADPLHLFDGGTAAPRPMAPVKPSSPSPASQDPLHLFETGGFPTPTSLPTSAPIPPTGAQGLPLPPIGLPKLSAKMPLPSVESRAVKEKKPFFLHTLLEPWAAKAKMPVWGLEAAAAGVVLILGLLLFFSLQKPAYQLVDQIVALHPTRTEVGEVVELDITAFIEIETRIKQLGFVPLTRLSVPQIPAPNFFSVYLHPTTKSYAIILKLPGVIAPKLSFVNVMSTGTWLSTNGWETQSPELDRLDSEAAPKDEPSTLWMRHQKHLEGAIASGMTVPAASEWRFMGSLSDHIRWFMALKDIPAYKAAFEEWF